MSDLPSTIHQLCDAFALRLLGALRGASLDETRKVRLLDPATAHWRDALQTRGASHPTNVQRGVRDGTKVATAALVAIIVCTGCGAGPVVTAPPVALEYDGPDASQPDTGPRPVADAGEPPDGDALCGPCVGMGTVELSSAVRRQWSQAKPCYDAALRRDATYATQVQVVLRISDIGSVCSAQFYVNGARDEAMLDCMRRIVAKTYPRPLNGCIDVFSTANFEPNAGASPDAASP